MKTLNNSAYNQKNYPKEDMFNQDVSNILSSEDGIGNTHYSGAQYSGEKCLGEAYLDPTLTKNTYGQNGNLEFAISTSMLDDPNIMKSDLLSILATAQGRRFLRRLFRSCGVFDYIPVGDQALYAWHEGRRSIGLIVYHSVFELGTNFINQLIMEDRNNT